MLSEQQSWRMVPSREEVVVFHVGLQLCETERVRRWLQGLDALADCVAVSSVELSVPLKVKDVVAAISAGRTRWVDLDLSVLRVGQVRGVGS